MKRLLAAGAIALSLHLILLMVKLPMPNSSARDADNLKAVSIRVFHSAPQENTVERQLDTAKKDGAYMIQGGDPVVKEQEIKQKEIAPHRKSISKKNPRRKLSGARMEKAVQKMEPVTVPIPASPNESEASTDMVDGKGNSDEKLISKDLSPEDKGSEGSLEPLALAQPRSVPMGSGEPLVEASPDYLLSPPPAYPLLARKKGYEGKVILDVLVDEEGLPAEIKIAQSSGYSILDNAAKSAVASWRFQPARRGNIALSMRVKVPVLFKLD